MLQTKTSIKFISHKSSSSSPLVWLLRIVCFLIKSKILLTWLIAVVFQFSSHFCWSCHYQKNIKLYLLCLTAVVIHSIFKVMKTMVKSFRFNSIIVSQFVTLVERQQLKLRRRRTLNPSCNER